MPGGEGFYGRLKFMGQKTGLGAYTVKPFVHVRITLHANNRIIKNYELAIIQRWTLTRKNMVSPFKALKFHYSLQ